MSDLKVARWRQVLACAVLAFAVALIGQASALYLLEPVQTAARSGIVAPTAEAVNTVRTGFGGLHLGPALIAAIGLFRPRYRQPALLFLVVLMAAVAGTRWTGIVTEGLAPPLPAVLEISAVIIFTIGLWAASPPKVAGE